MDRSYLPGDRVRILVNHEDISPDTEAWVVVPSLNGMVVVRLSDGRKVEVNAGDLLRTDQ